MPANVHIADHPSCWKPLGPNQERTPDFQHFNLYGKDVLSFEEHSIGTGSNARAMSCVEITTPARTTLFGVGIHENIVTASLLAVLSAVNRALQKNLLDDSMPVATAGG